MHTNIPKEHRITYIMFMYIIKLTDSFINKVKTKVALCGVFI